jgi:hypothetical protein
VCAVHCLSCRLWAMCLVRDAHLACALFFILTSMMRVTHNATLLRNPLKSIAR